MLTTECDLEEVVAVRRTVLRAVMMLVLLVGATLPASAQDLGVRAGMSGDPDQFYFGAHLYTGPIVERLRFRPNLELGLGDGITLTTVNIEFVYPLSIRRSPWQVLAGAGPALVIASHDGRRNSGGGFNILLGLEHRDGFFTELKIGALDSPGLKFGVGYTMRP